MAWAVALVGCDEPQPKSEFWGPPQPPESFDARTRKTGEGTDPWDPFGLDKSPGNEAPDASRRGAGKGETLDWDWDPFGLTKGPRSSIYTNPVYERRRRRMDPTWWEQLDDFFKELFGPDALKPKKKPKEMFPELKPVTP